MKNKCLFLDRDGIINVPLVKKNKPFAPTEISQFRLYKNLNKTLNYIKKLNYLIIIITNQPELSKGNLNKKTLDQMHEIIYSTFPIDDIFVCKCQESSSCKCYKPKPKMLYDAKIKHNIDLKKSYFVGDTYRDVYCASNAGCYSILLKKRYNYEMISKADYVIEKFGQIKKILKK